MVNIKRKIKVLIIDDSALVRSILKKGLEKDEGIDIIGAAPDVYIGRDLIVKHRPDVITLDIEMPKMDGIAFLKKLMPQFPIPVVIVSSLSQKGKQITLEALDSGAVDYVAKPASNIAQGLNEMMFELRTKIKIASTANVSHWKNKRFEKAEKRKDIIGGKALSESTDKVVAIGASTGGTEAIRQVIENLPITTPGIVIVQHMPKIFTKTFADRLNEISLLQVKEAEEGDRVMNGRVLIAPGDFHMTVYRSGGMYKVKLNQNEKVNGHRPAVDILFYSVAEHVGKNAYGIILTGMGADGAKGLKAMKEAGSKNIGQDKESSIVYGMPKVAYDMGAVDKQTSLNNISSSLINIIKNDKNML